MYQSVQVLLHLGIPLPLRALELNAFNHPWTYQVSYVSSSSFSSLFLAEKVTDQFRLLILVASCLMKASWLPTVLSMLADSHHWCPIIKDLIMDVSVSWVLKRLHLQHLTLWLLRDVFTDRVSLPWSVR